MSLQLITRGITLSDVERRLGLLRGGAEIFPIGGEHVGISIPTRLLDTVGEERVTDALRHLTVYDLYSGVWSGQ